MILYNDKIISIELINRRTSGINVFLDIEVKEKCVDTDTDIAFRTSLSSNAFELDYIQSSHKRLLTKEVLNYGFYSGDKLLGLWGNQNLEYEITLYDPRNSSDFQSRCNIFYQFLHDFHFPSNNDILETKAVQLRPFSFSFPRVREYVDENLCVLETEVASPYFQIRRGFDSNKEGVKFLRQQVVDLLTGHINEFEIIEDFIEIHLYRYDNEIKVKGEVSDFTWPTPNTIRFCEQANVDVLKQTLISLDDISEQIKKQI